MIYNINMIPYIIALAFIIYITFLLTSFFYIKKLKNSDEIIQQLTIRDEETGTYNRAFFEKSFIAEFQRARRIECPIALIFIETKDILELSNALKDAIKRETDFISRYENNKFVTVLYDTESSGVERITARVMESIPEGIIYNIGIHVALPDKHLSSRTMIDEGLKALDSSKRHGKNSIEFSLNSL